MTKHQLQEWLDNLEWHLKEAQTIFKRIEDAIEENLVDQKPPYNPRD